MKKGIHPEYYWDAQVICACGNTWTTGATAKVIRVEVCSQCHPFYTGTQRIVDTEGQVDRFMKRLQAAESYREERERKAKLRRSPERPVEDLPLDKEYVQALVDAGYKTVGDVLTQMETDPKVLVEVKGLGHQGFIELRKTLRKEGFTLPEAADTIPV